MSGGSGTLTASLGLWRRIGDRLCPGNGSETHLRSLQGAAAMEQLKPPILVTTVDTGDGGSAEIALREGDDPKVRRCSAGCTAVCLVGGCAVIKLPYPAKMVRFVSRLQQLAIRPMTGAATDLRSALPPFDSGGPACESVQKLALGRTVLQSSKAFYCDAGRRSGVLFQTRAARGRN